MDKRPAHEVVLLAVLFACIAGIVVLVLAQVFVEAQVPLPVAVSGGVASGWIRFVEPRLRARAGGARSQVRGMAEGIALGVLVALSFSFVS